MRAAFSRTRSCRSELASALRCTLPGDAVLSQRPSRRRKLSAAWLIEQAGWRGFRDGDAGFSAQHALVLVNHGDGNGRAVAGVARRVADSVEHEFGVRLEPEPRIVGATF